jgi:hypothetical protein
MGIFLSAISPVVCSKCGVPRTNYGEEPTQSCRVHDNEGLRPEGSSCPRCNSSGNCLHDFSRKAFCC